MLVCLNLLLIFVVHTSASDCLGPGGPSPK